MQCPKCESEMEQKNYGRKISVRRCTNCKGLWLTRDVLMQMKKEWMSEILDSGEPSVGREYDKLEDIQCPECQEKMDKVSDPDQVHIWYETCPNGHGIFLDAGEFTDLKYDTFIDRIRDMIKGVRK